MVSSHEMGPRVLIVGALMLFSKSNRLNQIKFQCNDICFALLVRLVGALLKVKVIF